MNEQVLTHVWEEQGLGKAPFALVAVISVPTTGLQEANPMAYQNAMSEACQEAKAHNVQLCTCEACGMGLVHNYVICDAAGHKFVVGGDCAAKTYDAKLIGAIEAQKKKAAKIVRAIKAEAERAKRAAQMQVELDAQRARNGGKTDGELRAANFEAEHRRRIAAELRAKAARNGWLIEVLEQAPQNDFTTAIISDLRTGAKDSTDLSPKLHNILGDIYAKVRGPQLKAAGWKRNDEQPWAANAKDVAYAEFGDKYRAAKAAR
jgi:hypothetical protein